MNRFSAFASIASVLLAGCTSSAPREGPVATLRVTTASVLRVVPSSSVLDAQSCRTEMVVDTKGPSAIPAGRMIALDVRFWAPSVRGQIECQVVHQFTPLQGQAYEVRLLAGTLGDVQGGIGNGFGIDRCKAMLLVEDNKGRTSLVTDWVPSKCKK